ncbi:hypothetical protein E4T47_08844 [Aureobasidium subglaciale]|nr:hypothetical protein E4T47_08844 [Aureobasidium subglaciale]
MAFPGGQPTSVEKKRINLMATKTQQSTTTALLPAIYDQSSSPLPPTPRVTEWQQSVPAFYGDVEMQDASAVNSAAGSPSSANYSHMRPQSSFSAFAKPFTPPGASVAANVSLCNTVPSPPHRDPASSISPAGMAPPTPVTRKAPPHRTLKEQNPAPAPAPTPAPLANKLVVPIVSAVDERNTQPTPKRARGPHSGFYSRSTPQAQKLSGSLSNMSFESISLPQIDSQPQTTGTSRDITPVSQNAWIDVQQPVTEPESWTDVQNVQNVPQVPTKTVKPSILSSVKPAQHIFKPEAVVDTRSTPKVAVDISSMPETVVEVAGSSVATIEARPAPEAVPPPHIKRLQATRDTAADDQQRKQTSETPSHYERTQWLSMLLDNKGTAEGRELIRAFSDHIRAGVEAGDMDATTPNSEQEIWMEFSAGQRLSARVANDTGIKHVIEEFAKMTHSRESEIYVMLKVGKKDHSA